MSPPSRRLLLLAMVVPLLGDRSEAQDTPEPEDLLPGLIVEFRPDVEQGTAVRRRSAAPVEDWGIGSPDPRLRPGHFSGSWDGWLLVRSAGLHRFHLRADGVASLRVGGEIVAETGGPRPMAIG